MFQYSQSDHSFHSGRSLLMCSLKVYFGSFTFGSNGARSKRIPASFKVRPPLLLLQRMHEQTMFAQVDKPPLERGFTWSSVYSLNLRFLPQYWHSPSSRR